MRKCNIIIVNGNTGEVEVAFNEIVEGFKGLMFIFYFIVSTF